MKKLYYLSIAIGLLCVQCDANKARQSKAENLITKSLFEKLPDYKSYENVSMEVDTLDYSILSNEKAYELADELYEINQDIFLAKREVEDSENDLKRLINRAAKRFWSNSMDLFDLANASNQMENLEKKIQTEKENLDKLYENRTSLIHQFEELNSKYDPNDLYGWSVSHKYRAKDESGNFQLFNHVYIINKDFSKIIYDYDGDNDVKEIILVSIIEEQVDLLNFEGPDNLPDSMLDEIE